MIQDQICHRCSKRFSYSEEEDTQYNDLVEMNGRKVVVDENDNSFPFYSMPVDKQKLIGHQFIKMECSECIKKSTIE